MQTPQVIYIQFLFLYENCVWKRNRVLKVRHVRSRFLRTGIFFLRLTHQQDIGKQVRAEQCAQSFTEYDSWGEDIDCHKEHGKIDDSHKYRAH